MKESHVDNNSARTICRLWDRCISRETYCSHLEQCGNIEINIASTTWSIPFRPVPMSWSSIALIWSWADIVGILCFYYSFEWLIRVFLANEPPYKALEKLIQYKMADTQYWRRRRTECDIVTQFTPSMSKSNVKDQMSCEDEGHTRKKKFAYHVDKCKM